MTGSIDNPAGINQATAAQLEQRLHEAGIRLTFGGEPTYVPVKPEGAEWSVAADGPTKLRYAKALGRELEQRVWPGSTLIYCPGKRYDGEVNPRWALRLITGTDGTPVVRWPQHGSAANGSTPQGPTTRRALTAGEAPGLLAAIGEGLMMGAKAGIPLDTVWEAIKSSAGNSWVAQHDVPSIFAGHYDPSFSLALCCKDLGLINQVAQSQGFELTMGALAQKVFQQAMQTYGPDAGELHVVRLLEERAGLLLRPPLGQAWGSDTVKS